MGITLQSPVNPCLQLYRNKLNRENNTNAQMKKSKTILAWQMNNRVPSFFISEMSMQRAFNAVLSSSKNPNNASR